MPIYFYLKIAGQTIDEALEFIDDIPINSNSKDILKRRIVQREVKYCKVPNTNTYVAKKKNEYIENIKNHSVIIPNDNCELKYCLAAFRGLDSACVQIHRDYILNVLFDIYSKYFNDKPFSSIKSDFRYALCWVDEALYLPDL